MVKPRYKLMCAVAWVACTASLCSCSSAQVQENVYEGLKSRERVVEPIPELTPPDKLPPYPEYEAQRRKLKAPEGTVQ